MPIYISDDLLIPPQEVGGLVIDADCPRIGINNIADKSNVLEINNTSYNPEYPQWLATTDNTSDKWKTNENVGHIFICTVPENTTIDYVGIAAHKGLVGQTLRIITQQRFDDSPSVDTVIFGPQIITSNESIFAITESLNTQDGDIYVYIIFGYVGAAADNPEPDNTFSMEVGKINIGKTVVIPRKKYVGHTPITMGRNAVKRINRSDSGETIGQYVDYIVLDSDFSVDNIPPDYARDNLVRQFQIPAETSPFFWAWRPKSYPAECAFVSAVGNVELKNTSPNGNMSISFRMSGALTNG